MTHTRAFSESHNGENHCHHNSSSVATIKMVFGPIPNREYHEGFMRKAIEMAELALSSDETPVGCVFVHNGKIIGRGINGTNASLNVCVPSVSCPQIIMVSFTHSQSLPAESAEPLLILFSPPKRAPATQSSSPSPKSWPSTPQAYCGRRTST